MKSTIQCLVGVFVLCVSPQVIAQESPLQRHEMATNQLKRLALEMSERCLNDVTTLEQWNSQRLELRRQLLDMLGLDPLPKRTALKAPSTGRVERDAYRIENVVFQSMPGLYVTGNFYVPKGTTEARLSFAKAPAGRPTVLYLCGHSPHPL